MNCPRDYTAFERSVVEDQTVERCPECDGIWIPGESIDTLLGKGERLKLRSLCSARPSQLVCPYHHVELGETKIGGVTVDLCPECSGLWLDPGELENLRARPRMKEKESPMRTALIADGKRGSLDSTDIVSDGLLALFLAI